MPDTQELEDREVDGARRTPTRQDGEMWPAVTFVADDNVKVERPDSGDTISFSGGSYTTSDPYEIALLDSDRMPKVRRLDDGGDPERERVRAAKVARDAAKALGATDLTAGERAWDDKRFARDVNAQDKGQPPLAPGAPITHGPGVIGTVADAQTSEGPDRVDPTVVEDAGETPEPEAGETADEESETTPRRGRRS